MIFTYPVNYMKKAVALTFAFPETCKLQPVEAERMSWIPGVAIVKILHEQDRAYEKQWLKKFKKVVRLPSSSSLS